MNISSALGLLVGCAVIYFAVTSGMENSRIFLDAHAAIIVLGGTLAVALIMFPLRYFFNIFLVYLRVITGRTRQEIYSTINEIVKLSVELDRGRKLDELIPGTRNAFLKESLGVLAQGGLSVDELDEVLEKRVQIQNEEYKRDAAAYKTLGKFPPAFGLVGATLGMIALLQGLGGEGAFERIGPAMSIALVATFYGLVFANFFIIPVGENLQRASQEDLLGRRLVVDGVRLIQQKKHPLLVEEHLRSYLRPSERNRMAKTQGV
jgi:chemotaxis protein MotA